MPKDKPLEQRCRYKTERLLVENWKEQISTSISELDFAKKIVNILTDEVTKTLPNGWQGIDTVERAIAWFKKRIEESAVFTIQFLANKEIIGFLFLKESDSTEIEGNELKLGYLLSKEVWGQGLGSELIRGLVEWCRADGGISTISCGVEVDNLASIKILKKNGFSASTSEKPPHNMIFLERKFEIKK
jgi:RimJ/RimL family protein N-acetyltransferase